MRIAIAAMTAAFLLASGAQAQVSDADYPQYYDYIMDHGWYCLTKQPFDAVESGTLETNMTLHFERKNTYEAYRFTGDGAQVMTVEGRDYNGRFSMEGFGVNDSSFGTGITIVSTHVTEGDPLPEGWNWNDGAYINLHLVSDQAGGAYPYEMQGSENFDGGQITVECMVKDS